MQLNIIIGSSGLIGSEIYSLLSKNKSFQNIAVDVKKCVNHSTIKIDLTDYDYVENFIKNLNHFNDYHRINLIYLAATDAKLGNSWSYFEDFDPLKWRKMSVINQEALLFFVSRFIKKLLNEHRKEFSSQIIFFPSLYNYLAPDHSLYADDMSVRKPFEYIGTKSLCRDLMKYINATYSSNGIFSNCVVPHLVVGDNTVIPSKLRQRTCTKKATLASEVAEVVNFLICGPQNLIGQEIKVDGGWTQR